MKTNRNLNEWLTTNQESIADWNYYFDWKKINGKLTPEKIKNLNLIATLIGSGNIEGDFRNLMISNPEILRNIPELFGVNNSSKMVPVRIGNTIFKFDFNIKKDKNGKWVLPMSIDSYEMFMRNSGLFRELLENPILKNPLLAFYNGLQAGLNTNARKNRSGHLMEDIVEEYIQKAGFIKNESYFKEMYIHEIQEKWGYDLSAISNKGTTEKRFDYVVKTPNHLYLIETNFYGTSGSKLNEVSRSYKKIAEEVKEIPNVTFVWFTDGIGWKSTKGNLQETWDVLDTIYNISDMKKGIMTKIFK